MSLARTNRWAGTGATPQTNAGPSRVAGTNCPSWCGTPRSSMVHHTTPSEYQLRIRGADSRWAAAAPIVSAFEDLRYGERAPDLDTVARARDALRAVEAVVRT